MNVLSEGKSRNFQKRVIFATCHALKATIDLSFPIQINALQADAFLDITLIGAEDELTLGAWQRYTWSSSNIHALLLVGRQRLRAIVQLLF